MNKLILLIVIIGTSVFSSMRASVLWDFSDASYSPHLLLPGIEGSEILVENPWGTVANPFPLSASSSGYPGASGGDHLGMAIKTGGFSLENSSYTSFLLSVVLLDHTFHLESFSFGSRTTATGPQAFSLRWSLDGYASDLALGSLLNDSTWRGNSIDLSGLYVPASSDVEFRLYWFDGQGTAVSGVINHRIDDLRISGSLQSIPEPTTFIIFCLGIGGLWISRRFKWN